MSDALEVLIDVKLLEQVVNALDVDAICALDEGDRLTAWAVIEDANRVLQQVRSVAVRQIAESMSDWEVTVNGIGTFKKHVQRSRTQWDCEDLLRVVRDSRLVNVDTGEIAEESELDKVRHVWNLGAPRTGALKERGIDADEFCHVERRGHTIELVR